MNMNNHLTLWSNNRKEAEIYRSDPGHSATLGGSVVDTRCTLPSIGNNR